MEIHKATSFEVSPPLARPQPPIWAARGRVFLPPADHQPHLAVAQLKAPLVCFTSQGEHIQLYI